MAVWSTRERGSDPGGGGERPATRAQDCTGDSGSSFICRNINVPTNPSRRPADEHASQIRKAHHQNRPIRPLPRQHSDPRKQRPVLYPPRLVTPRYVASRRRAPREEEEGGCGRRRRKRSTRRTRRTPRRTKRTGRAARGWRAWTRVLGLVKGMSRDDKRVRGIVARRQGAEENTGCRGQAVIMRCHA